MIRQFTICLLASVLFGCGLALDNEDRIARGESALANGEIQAAVIDAKDVLRDEPDNLRARLLLGRASIQIADGAAAEKELRRAVALGADSASIALELAKALLMQRKFQQLVDEIQLERFSGEDRFTVALLRADALMGLGEFEAARDHYVEAAQESPDDVEALLGVVSTYMAEQNFVQASAGLDHILANYPEDIRGWLANGELNYLSGQFASAQANFETAAKVAERTSDLNSLVAALTGLAESQLALQNVEGARETVAKLVDVAPYALEARMLVSRIAFIDEDWATAKQTLHLALLTAPDFTPAQFWLGAVNLRSSNFSQADMYLSSVIAAAPESDDARRMLVETRLLLGRAEDAGETLRPLLLRDDIDPRDLMLAARMHMWQGDSESALDYLQRSVAQKPANSEFAFEYAILLLQSGRTDELDALLAGIDVSTSPEDALKRDLLATLAILRGGQLDQGFVAARQLVEDWPKSPDAHNLFGSVQVDRDHLLGAKDSFENALRLDADNLTAQRYLAEIDVLSGDLGSARDRYLDIVAKQPDATWAMFALARLAAREEDLGQTEALLQEIRELDSDAVAPRAALASIYLAKQDYSLAASTSEEALKLRPSSPELYTLLGHARLGLNDIEGAIVAYQDALDLDQASANARLNLANAQRLAGKRELAEQTLRSNSSVEELIEHLPSAVSFATFKIENGELEDAAAIATALQERYPGSAIPVALEAEVQVEAGQLDQAIETYDRALSIKVERTHAIRAHSLKSQLSRSDRNAPLEAYLEEHPDDSNLRMVLAQSLHQDNHLERAIRELETVSLQEPDNVAALNNLAWSYHLAGDPRAAEMARRALAKVPNSGAVTDTLGWILLQDGQLDEGVEVLERAVNLSNGRAEVRYHYAVGLWKQGDAEDARLILQDIVGGDDEFASRTEAIQLLEKL